MTRRNAKRKKSLKTTEGARITTYIVISCLILRRLSHWKGLPQLSFTAFSRLNPTHTWPHDPPPRLLKLPSLFLAKPARHWTERPLPVSQNSFADSQSSHVKFRLHNFCWVTRAWTLLNSRQFFENNDWADCWCWNNKSVTVMLSCYRCDNLCMYVRKRMQCCTALFLSTLRHRFFPTLCVNHLIDSLLEKPGSYA